MLSEGEERPPCRHDGRCIAKYFWCCIWRDSAQLMSLKLVKKRERNFKMEEGARRLTILYDPTLASGCDSAGKILLCGD